MKTATVADLRNHFRRLSAWIENGESVQIVKRGKPFARLMPMTEEKPVNIDFAAQRKTIWGGRVFTKAEVQAMDDYVRERE
jgi:antitoxin (DNA-binding transcriptional repressor) of toxin-antitoxin stability system